MYYALMTQAYLHAASLMCWIGRIIGTCSDVNEENVIQTFSTDSILRPKKSLKWLVSKLHLTNVWLFEKLVTNNFAESFFLVWYD